MSDLFDRCSKCNTILEMFHPWRFQEDWNGGHICKHCIEEKNAATPPWDDHMMQTVEPYIQWRENQAVGAYALSVIENRIEK